MSTIRWAAILFALPLVLALKEGESPLRQVFAGILGKPRHGAPKAEPVPMRVIGAGFGRTSTNSLMMALDRLGHKTYHMEKVRALGHHSQWARVRPSGGRRARARAMGSAETNQTALAEMLDMIGREGFDAGVDFPISLAYREVMEHHPESLVILSVRSSAEVWAKSYTETIGQMGAFVVKPPLSYVLPGGEDMFEWMMDVSGLPGLDEAVSFEKSAAAYTAWNEKVKAHVPADRLLVHAATDGWPPLCAFLGVAAGECPSDKGEKYPRASNDAAAMKRAIGVIKFLTGWWNFIVACLFLFAVLAVWVVYYCLSRCCCRVRSEKLKWT